MQGNFLISGCFLFGRMQNSIFMKFEQRIFANYSIFAFPGQSFLFFVSISPLFGTIRAQLSRSTQKTEPLHVVEHKYESMPDSASCKSYAANNIPTKVFDCTEYMGTLKTH